MKKIMFIFLLILVCFKFYTERDKVEENFRDTIHFIYLPWDREGKLKKYHHSFDKYFYLRVKKEVPNGKVYMWTYNRLRRFSEEREPGLWDKLWALSSHPVQIVDFYRWFVVYHLGGLYWQYESVHSVPWEMFSMGGQHEVVLYTEKILSDSITADIGNEHPIRGGKREENLRVCTQLFWAKPKSRFIQHVLHTIIERMEKYTVKEDYDILYIGGNAMISEVYDRYPQRPGEIKLVDLITTMRMALLSSHGSWRREVTPPVSFLKHSDWKNVLRPVYISVYALFQNPPQRGVAVPCDKCDPQSLLREAREGEDPAEEVF